MKMSWNDSLSDPATLTSLFVCPKCQRARRVEMKTPVALADGLSTVTLVCDSCGLSTVETCRD
jgi:hypothetical protein